MMTTRIEFKNDYKDEIQSLFPSASLTGGAWWRDFVHVDDENVVRDRHRLVEKYSWAIPSPAAIYEMARVVHENNLNGIIEIGAGNGYWAYCLNQVGVDVIAVDSGETHTSFKSKHWHPIIKGGPPHAAKHPDRALFLCWPPMSTHKKVAGKISRRRPKWDGTKRLIGAGMSEADAQAAYDKYCNEACNDWSYWHRVIQHVCGPTNMGGASLQRFAGEWVFYVGEPNGGCTGDETMWEILSRDFALVAREPVYQYSGIHDELCIYRRGKS